MLTNLRLCCTFLSAYIFIVKEQVRTFYVNKYTVFFFQIFPHSTSAHFNGNNKRRVLLQNSDYVDTNAHKVYHWTYFVVLAQLKLHNYESKDRTRTRNGNTGSRTGLLKGIRNFYCRDSRR